MKKTKQKQTNSLLFTSVASEETSLIKSFIYLFFGFVFTVLQECILETFEYFMKHKTRICNCNKKQKTKNTAETGLPFTVNSSGFFYA